MHHIEISKYIYKQAQLGVPHSRIQVELKLQLNLQDGPCQILKGKKTTLGGDTAQKKYILEGGDTAHTLLMRGTIRVGTPHILC